MKSHAETLRFGEFTLDPANRQLSRGGTPLDLGGRYLDTLILLVRERGSLISKDRLHEEVWRGVPVTDEAFSQAIMALRRALGDDAAKPRYIETVPRHGYRFLADVESAKPLAAGAAASPIARRALLLTGGGILGAAVAGLLVGLIYGSLAASRGAGSALSLVLVLICVSILAASVSGLGIAGGIALLHRPGRTDWWRAVLGGGFGGLVMGGFARLLGMDTLRLLTGSAPDRIAGASEGLIIGLATGLAFWLACRRSPSRDLSALGFGGLLGAIGGLAIILTGGTLMAGSLAALTARFPSATLSLAWAGEPAWLAVSGAFEGAIFAGLVVAGMMIANRN